MKFPKIFLIFFALILMSQKQCSDGKKLDKEAPTELVDVYYEKWMSGVKGGGAGYVVYIETKDNKVEMDSVYFKGYTVKLETKKQNPNLFIGHITTQQNKLNNDVIMVGDTQEEYGKNKINTEKKLPFKINEKDGVVSFKIKGKKRYFLLSDIQEKPMLQYPQ